MDRNILVENRQSARGYLKWAVIDAVTKKVIRDSGQDWIPNLILNNGMNRIYSDYWVNAMIYAIAGTGTTPTSSDSGGTTAAQSGTNITSSSGFFSSGDVGNTVKFTSGEEALITAFNSSTSVTVSNSATVSSTTFVVYSTSQTGLVNEQKRTNTYLTGSGNCGTTQASNQFQNRRTYDFTAETGTVNYTEIGFGWAVSGANTTFSRILLPSPIPVLSGQQLRVVYELRVSVGPTTPQPVSAIINGWPISPATDTDGDECVQMYGLAGLNTSGAMLANDTASWCNEPSFLTDLISFSGATLNSFLSDSSTAISGSGSAPNRTGTVNAQRALTKAAYVTNSFYVDKSVTYLVGEANSTLWRSMGYGLSQGNISANPYQANRTAFVLVFDQAQTKPNTHTLTLTFRTTWSRVLS
jgi:hypothetical protein